MLGRQPALEISSLWRPWSRNRRREPSVGPQKREFDFKHINDVFYIICIYFVHENFSTCSNYLKVMQ